MLMTNVEIKARSSDNFRVKEILNSRKAVYIGKDHQIDIYFRVNHGRLKLRKGNIENALIYYEREDKKDAKESRVIISEFPPNNLEEVLTKSLGIVVTVDKEREIYLIGNVKFYLDNVQGLGEFVEIEAIDYNGNMGREKLLEQCSSYKELFVIKESDLVVCSYSDLLLINMSRHY